MKWRHGFRKFMLSALQAGRITLYDTGLVGHAHALASSAFAALDLDEFVAFKVDEAQILFE